MDLQFFFPFFDYEIAFALMVFVILVYAAQSKWPLRRWRSSKFHHLMLNGLLTLPSVVVLRAAVIPVAYLASVWAESNKFGLLNILAWSTLTRYVLAFLLLDLTFYYWHVLNHKVPLFWRFHNVHHVDLDLEVTTAFRFHFGEMLFSIVFRAVQLAVLGISPGLFFVYEGLFQAATVFQHSNWKLPVELERKLVYLIVTPRMHGIHHSIVRQETDSNFSVIFSFWDRLHRTVRLNVHQGDLTIGVPAYQDPRYHTVPYLLSLPFRKQKSYWQREDGSQPVREMHERSDPAWLFE